MSKTDKAYIVQVHAANKRIEELNNDVCEEDGEQKMTPKTIQFLHRIAVYLRQSSIGEIMGDPAIGIENDGGANVVFRKAGRRYSIIIHPNAQAFDLYSVDTPRNTIVHDRLDYFDISRIYLGFEALFGDLACAGAEETEEVQWDVAVDSRWAAHFAAQSIAHSLADNKNVIPFPARGVAEAR